MEQTPNPPPEDKKIKEAENNKIDANQIKITVPPDGLLNSNNAFSKYVNSNILLNRNKKDYRVKEEVPVPVAAPAGLSVPAQEQKQMPVPAKVSMQMPVKEKNADRPEDRVLGNRSEERNVDNTAEIARLAKIAEKKEEYKTEEYKIGNAAKNIADISKVLAPVPPARIIEKKQIEKKQAESESKKQVESPGPFSKRTKILLAIAIGLFVVFLALLAFRLGWISIEPYPTVTPIVTPAPTAEPDRNLDTDIDNLPDMIEKALGTDLNNADTDGDTYSDLHEIKNGYSPLVAGGEGKYVSEDLQAVKDKIKAADPEFYEKEFGTGTESSPSPTPESSLIPTANPSSSPEASSSPVVSPSLSPSLSANPKPNEVIISFTCGVSAVSDIEDNTYNTVSIGDQCWLKENLKVAKNPEKKSITRYCYNNDSKNCDSRGGLYDWATAMNNSTEEGAQGICPTGWHIPRDSEWYGLENYLKDPGRSCSSTRDGISGTIEGEIEYSGDCDPAGTKLKIGGSSGFEAVLAGGHSKLGSFFGKDLSAVFWSSTKSGSDVWNRLLKSSDSAITRLLYSKNYGFSVRCIGN